MPALSRWCVRCALAYLVAGMAMGSWMLIEQARDGRGPGPPWPVLHAHLLLVGFLLLLIFGVAFWMFPKVAGARPGREVGWVAFALLNAGVLLRVLAEPLADHGRGAPVWDVLLGIAAVLPALAAVAFAIAVWPRVRAVTSTPTRNLRPRTAPEPEPPRQETP
jgi:hypothetical protein